MTPFLIILFTLTVIIGKALWNWYLIEKEKKSPKHGLELVIVALLFFAAFFDLFLNTFRGLPPLHYGEKALIDKLFQKLGIGAYVMYKIFALILLVTATVQIFKLW